MHIKIYILLMKKYILLMKNIYFIFEKYLNIFVILVKYKVQRVLQKIFELPTTRFF